ncbi:MAG: hypothetical protein Cons2KO_06430 [Congregibacter sp.]
MLDLLVALINLLFTPGLLLGLVIGGLVGWVMPQFLSQSIDIVLITKSALCGGIAGTVIQYTVFGRK